MVGLQEREQRDSLVALIGMLTSPFWEVLFLLYDDCETPVVLDLSMVTLVNHIEDPAAVATGYPHSPILGHLFPAESLPCSLLLYPGAPCCSTASPLASVAELVIWSL